jgi:hypothetical protein
VALEASSPEEAVRIFQREINRLLNQVLKRYRLEVRSRGSDFFLLYFLRRGKEPIAIPLSKRPWHLYLGQTLDAKPLGRNRFQLKTAAYQYRLQASAAITEEPFVRFEYVGQKADPAFAYCRNHVQFHRDYDRVLPPFSPLKFHLPTGWVTIESVIHFALTDMGVTPLRKNWQQVLAESERKFRAWTARP